MAVYGRRSGRATKKGETKRKKAGKSSAKSSLPRKKPRLRTKTAGTRVAKVRKKAACARAKKRAARRPVRVRAKAKAEPKKRARGKPKAAPKKPAKRKKATATSKKRRVKPAPKARAKRKAKPKRKAAPAPKKRKPAAKAPVKKKTRAAAKAPAKKKPRAAKRSARRTKADILAENRKFQAEIAALRAAQGTERAKGPRTNKAKLKRQIVAERQKRLLERAHVEAAVKTSKSATWERLHSRFFAFLRAAGRARKLPSGSRVGFTFISQRWEGEQRKVRIRRLLTPASIPEILYQVQRGAADMRGDFPVWGANVAISGFGEKLVAYGNRMLDASDVYNDTEGDWGDEDADRAQLFMSEGYQDTGPMASLQGMMHELETMLEGMASAENTRVYVHWIVVRHARMKQGRT